MYDELVKELREISGNRAIPVHMAETAKEAADAIEELTKPRWIPVTERLPEAYTSVLLYSDEDLYTGYMHSDKRFTVKASNFANRPTHWMPLPAPPKEET